MVGGVIGKNIQGTQNFQRERAKSMTVPIARSLALKNAPTLPSGIGSKASQTGQGETKAVNRSTQDDDFDILTDEDTDYDSEDYEAEDHGFVKNDAKGVSKKDDDSDASSKDDDDTFEDTDKLQNDIVDLLDQEAKSSEEDDHESDDSSFKTRGRSKSEPIKFERVTKQDDTHSEFVDDDLEESEDFDFGPNDLSTLQNKTVASIELKKQPIVEEETESDTTEENDAQPQKDWVERQLEKAIWGNAKVGAKAEIKAEVKPEVLPEVQPGNQNPQVVVAKDLPDLQQFGLEEHGEIEAGIGVNDGGKILNDDIKKPFKERAKEKLADVFSKMKTGWESFKFALSDLFVETSVPHPSKDGHEARLDRKHFFLEPSRPELNNVHNVDAMEAFLNINWTGDTYKDSKIFHKISNMLTKLEGNARRDFESLKGQLPSLERDLAGLRKEQKKLRGYVDHLKEAIKKSVSEETRNKNLEKVELRIKELQDCNKKIEDAKQKIKKLNIDGSTPDMVRLENARNLVASSSDLHLSEVSLADLQILANKFASIGHESKAKFVRTLISEIELREIKSSPEELKQMRRDRDEEIKENNYKPTLSYKTKLALDHFNVNVTDESIDEKLSESAKTLRRKEIEEQKALNMKQDLPKVSLNMRKMLADLKSDYAAIGQDPGAPTFEEFMEDQVYEMVKSAKVHQIKDFHPETIGEIVKELRNQGHEERAKLLALVSAKVVYIKSPKGQEEIYRPIVMDGLAQSNNAETFLRSGSDEIAVAMATLMNASGMETFRDQVTDLVFNFAKELDEDQDIKALMERIQKEQIAGWANGMTEGVAKKIAKIAIRLQEEIGKLEIPPGVKKLFGELSKQFLERPTVDEKVGEQDRGNGLTERDKNIFVHKIFADQLFLKVINPAITTSLPVANAKNEISKSVVRLMSMVSAFSQDSANQSNLKDPKAGKVDKYLNVKTEGPQGQFALDIFGLSVELAKRQDQMFIKAGLRPEATSKNILNLRDIE
ncbi:coiled-coil domain-containing protein [Rhizobium alvei]|uniref:Uncharacterized protein n=1 Tax=Rhizobium alvei TaxID=1132659 RepID=A0ABT8YTB1_9HYPH|nr:hypothetical protein [Rhizobium alvei]MDO6966460.1 hypothetical protein [Rhizobium alvei]